MNEHAHIAMNDLYTLVRQANRKQACRATLGPVAMRMLRDQYAPYDGEPPPDVTETLMGLPITGDDEIPDFGWQLHDHNNQVVHAGCFTVHDHDCGHHE